MTAFEEKTAVHAVRSTPRWSRMIVGSTSAMTFALAQMAPMVLITAAFLLRGDELSAVTWGGLPVVFYLAATSVIVPLAAQAFSGPVYASMGGLPRRHHSAVAARCLRVLPLSLLTGVPAALLLAVIVAASMGLSLAQFAAFLCFLSLNVAFAVSLTFAYVVSSAPVVVTGWAVFAGSLVLAPTLWWLPATAATLICASAVWLLARLYGQDESETPSIRVSFVASARGLATALPLWGLPLAVFIADPSGTSMAALFLAILPAVLLYQVYFSLVARPLWGEIDLFRRGLERAEPSALYALGAPIRRSTWRGELVLGLGVAISVALLVVVSVVGIATAPIFAPLVAASVAGTVFIAETTRLSMVSSSAASVWGGVVLAFIYLAAWPLVGVDVSLWIFAGVALCAAGVVAAYNSQYWRQLEFQLFWRQAVSA